MHPASTHLAPGGRDTMDIRTSMEIIEFRRPFAVRCRAGYLPAGQYVVELHEERFDGLSFPPWRRSGMTIASAEASHDGKQSKLPLTVGELADLLNADADR